MRKLILALLFFGVVSAKAQLSEFTQYQFNYYAINPALAGENGPFTIKAIVGNQFNGNLRFNQLSHVLVLDGQLYNKTGIAFKSSNDNFGVGVNNNLGLSLSKGFEVGSLKLKGGINGGVSLTPSRMGLGNANTKTDFNFGVGIIGNFEGIFVGVSKPVAYVSKNSFIGESPTFVNVGYASPDDYVFLTANLNVLYAHLNGNNNYDFNLKFWFDKRLGIGGSYRINNIYTILTKKNTFLPFVEYKFSKDLMLGLGYDPNSLRLSNTTSQSNPNFRFSGLFQFYIRYNKSDDKGDSWFYDRL